MPTVAIYKFLGVFDVKPEFVKDHPGGVSTHQGILFLKQVTEERFDAAAAAICVKRFQLRSATIEAFAILDVEGLNRPVNAAFAPNYEQALREGSSLIWYTNPPPEPAADPVLFSGFSPSSR